MELAHYREVVERIRDSGVDVIINLTTGPGQRFIPSPDDPKVAAPGSTLMQPLRRVEHILALKPEILLLDEVTSALDPELVNEVLDTIRDLAKDGMTMLIVSHEMAFVREVASKVVMMDKGKVVEVGSPADIFDRPKSDRAREFVGKILRH
jgi:ABC-type antimicrobial peptide transport system ATPase subunit